MTPVYKKCGFIFILQKRKKKLFGEKERRKEKKTKRERERERALIKHIKEKHISI